MFALLTFLKENNFTLVVYLYQLGHLGNEKEELGIRGVNVSFGNIRLILIKRGVIKLNKVVNKTKLLIISIKLYLNINKTMRYRAAFHFSCVPIHLVKHDA